MNTLSGRGRGNNLYSNRRGRGPGGGMSRVSTIFFFYSFPCQLMFSLYVEEAIAPQR